MNGRFARSFILLLGAVASANADWPALHGSVERTGFRAESLTNQFHLAWARHFSGERLGTAMEAIVSEGRVFVGTHSGNLYSLDARSGNPLWRFHTEGAFLQSPAVSSGLVMAASTDGNVYALKTGTGELAWSFAGEFGGFSASPTVVGRRVYIGSRNGTLFALTLATGRLEWKREMGAPVRQTASADRDRLFVTAEDLRVRAFDLQTGKLLWTSAQLAGQTARDYYPVVAERNGRTFVIVRTNPILNMANQIGRDRHLLAQTAGFEDSDWRKVDAWIKSDRVHGSPDLWKREQEAIIKYLEDHPEAQTFHVLEASTGQRAFTAPILWAAGCQGVGTPPALCSNGKLLVFYRSAYGNWNHGVAPLVALGLYDLADNKIEPLFHQQGLQPAWNNFWGTADETENFSIAGSTVLISHQGTLSGFDLNTNRLFPIAGERDTYGGFKNLPWARNEWHGPGRGAVAVDSGQLFWMTGSRVLCFSPRGEQSSKVDAEIKTAPIAAGAPDLFVHNTNLIQELRKSAREVLATNWAPLFVEPGLAGKDFSFDHSGVLFEALSRAYPHLDSDLQGQVKARLAREWMEHPPFSKGSAYDLREGARREFVGIPAEELARAGSDRLFLPFGNMGAVFLYAERCDEWPRVLRDWPAIKDSFADFHRSGWRLDPAKGDRFANRYFAALDAFMHIATKSQDFEAAGQAAEMMAATKLAIGQWWKRVAAEGTLGGFKGSSELDRFITAGDALSFRIAPHRHKLALFEEMSPELMEYLEKEFGSAVEIVWKTFSTLYPTWYLLGEERQVHYGENFVDPPDLAMSAYRTFAARKTGTGRELADRSDLPFGKADLFHLIKMAMACDRGRAPF